MNQRFFTLLIFAFFSLAAIAQPDEEEEIISTAMIPAKILQARHEYNINNMRGALTTYRAVLKADPTNSTVMFGIAQCHYSLKKYKLALEYADKAVANGAKVDNLFKGKCHQRMAELDRALYYFDLVTKEERKGSDLYDEGMLYINQCEYAKDKMEKPVDVTVQNLGSNINSRFEEYTPSVTADGKMLFFTSRRSDTKGGRIDEYGDYKYFEDIYLSEWDSVSNEWASATSIPGEVNTEAYDAVLSVFPDGSGLFVYKNKGESAGDIFFSDRNAANGSYKDAEKFPRPINSSYYEGSVSITEDGNTLYFISERPEGLGNGDIYYSVKEKGRWTSPKNIGKLLNTPEDEKFVFIHPNGRTLYFSSNGHRSMGSYDIYRSDFVNGQWTTPINLGYPINTVNEESTFSLTRDNKTMYLAAEYDDSYGERDIYSIDVSRYDLISKGYERSFIGQLSITVKSATGDPEKGVTVNVYNDGGSQVMATSKTDKLGLARINLEGNQPYTIEVVDKERKVTQNVFLKLNDTGETVMPVEVTLK